MKIDNQKYHIPVMLKDSIEALKIDPSGNYIDGTLGEAGHSIEILSHLVEGSLTSYDRDIEAVDFVKQRFKEVLDQKSWTMINDNFSNMDKYHSPQSIDGIILDLGLSSRHLDIKGRGFSYKNLDDPLDMRMDSRLGVKASDLINALNEKQLTQLFIQYGEERAGRRIASAIKKANKKIESVRDLTDVIDREVPVTLSKEKAYRRIFQALRIVVNDELDSLRSALLKAFELLKPGGRLVVITFQSLEDRIVKDIFKDLENKKKGLVILRAQKPSEKEIEENKRSHSAKMSVLEKI